MSGPDRHRGSVTSPPCADLTKETVLWCPDCFTSSCDTMFLYGEPVGPASMRKLLPSALLIFLVVLPTAASDQDDAAADTVAATFMQARQAANLSKLERMGRNTFREKVCKQDMRFASGLIIDVVYQTSDPARLPEAAQRLARWPDTSKTAARFGVGVCSLNNGSLGQPRYSVLIATYESRLASFWRIFWD